MVYTYFYTYHLIEKLVVYSEGSSRRNSTFASTTVEPILYSDRAAS